MSNPSVTTTTVQTPPVPKLHVLKRVNIFGGSFLVGLVSNLILIVAIFTLGVSTGLEGQLSFSWAEFGNSIAFLFGGFASLLWLIGGIAVLMATLWAVHRLSSRGHHNWVVAAFLAGLIVGGFILWRLVDWGSFGFGIVPFLGLLAYTAFWAAVAAFVIPALSLSRKRGTN